MTGNRIDRAIRFLHLVEDALLVVLLTAMVGLSAAQILLRNLLETGMAWADPLLRLLVLWLCLAGALAATRVNKHIRIDVVSRVLPPRVSDLLDRLTGLFTAAVCALIAWEGARLVRFEYQDGTELAAGIPAWTAELVIPLGFALIALRFALHALTPRHPEHAP